MPRESYNVRVLKLKALSSARSAVVAFNGLDDDGRVTEVLLRFQHAFEMLLKAALESSKVRVFDRRSGRAIGLEACIRQAQQEPSIKLTETEAGTIRAIDALRDAEQHWHVVVDEGLLYVHVRAGVTLLDDILARVFGERLADHLPSRVLPISSEPPQDLQLLVDREFQRVAALLQPGRRATSEANARIRALLATEALADAALSEVSESDVRRVAKGIRDGKSRQQVFPNLGGYTTAVSGSGLTVEVRLVRSGGLPVTYTNDETVEPAAIRTVHLESKFYMGANELADRSGVKRNKAVALRRHLGLDDSDDKHSHRFVHGGMKLLRYSDNALRAMQSAAQDVDIDRIYAAHRTPSYRSSTVLPPCDQPGCQVEAPATP